MSDDEKKADRLKEEQTITAGNAPRYRRRQASEDSCFQLPAGPQHSRNIVWKLESPEPWPDPPSDNQDKKSRKE
jgi:hypothetical protein